VLAYHNSSPAVAARLPGKGQGVVVSAMQSTGAYKKAPLGGRGETASSASYG